VTDTAAVHTPNEGEPPTDWQLEARLQQEGLTEIRWWSNQPGARYERHDHPFHKVLYCAAGSITFHVDKGDLELAPGDRLDVEPGTPHEATVGTEGVRCVEAPRHT
jgi:quercetin dioxygenase-like cupin family protein